MRFPIRIHFDNSANLNDPFLWIWYDGSDQPDEFAPTGSDDYGLIFDCTVKRSRFSFKFKQGSGVIGPWEPLELDRDYRAQGMTDTRLTPNQIWCKGDRAFVYTVLPRSPELISAADFLASLPLPMGSRLSEAGGLSGLGATLLADGRVLFGLYHPNAARVYGMGSFNNWQNPGVTEADESQFFELKLYSGYFGLPNLWLGISDLAQVGDEYKFWIEGGVPSLGPGKFQKIVTDPYARQLGNDFQDNNAVIVNPNNFNWQESQWTTPSPNQLILYELSVYGFTEGDRDIAPANQGRFAGITERIDQGYFEQLGITALSLMPLSEAPSPQGPNTLGYDPSLYCAVERDFGSPDDLRQLVNTAHQQNIAVILDQVFNHTSSNFNPLWELILEHPREEHTQEEGGLYFNGGTPWGNRIATEKLDVQNMLIDACKLWIDEYHVDGFRFDATHTDFMDHGFLQRLANELQAFKPDVILIAENLPNQSDLNRAGFDGYGQWCDPFHDKMKAILREGQFQGDNNGVDKLADILYFSKSIFASHTNNVVNYCESHDETSVAFEVGSNPALNQAATKDRKGRLGLFSTIVAVGQPMIYMGQEFNVERDRNIVSFTWPSPPESNGFFQWASRLIQLRKRYPALKLEGYNPASTGQFVWILGPWMGGDRGGGQKVLGWRSHPTGASIDTMVVLLNYENRAVTVNLDLGISGVWIKLADMDQVNDLPPNGSNSIEDPTVLRSEDGFYGNFSLPSSSGFIYKWAGGL